MPLELRVTSDRSHTLFNTEVNECYHSTHGAIQESKHVFIKAGLEHVAAGSGVIRILEIGFGTGLNALLTIAAAHEKKIDIEYTAVETFPVSAELIDALNYPEMIGNESAVEWYPRIHKSPWDSSQRLTDYFTLTKFEGRIQEVILPQGSFDLAYFDAFAPQKQPDMWLPDVLRKVAGTLRDGGCLVTYCAKGQVKRDLRAVGFVVESLPGPPGKREMIRATRHWT